jgi:hypothetical protein
MSHASPNGQLGAVTNMLLHYCIKPCAGRHLFPFAADFLLALLCKNEYRGAGKNVWFVTLGKPSVRGRSGHGGEG